MPNIDQAGMPITADVAQKYIEAYLPLKDCLKKKVLKKITPADEAQDNDFTGTKKFFDSDVNAFLFSKETVMRFFEKEADAGYLMVILAAKFKEEEAGIPTVVIAGVNKTDNNTFVSLNIKDPATEQPPRIVITEFPQTAVGQKTMLFNIK